jgi:chloramphenicol-sensitive protein RarD
MLKDVAPVELVCHRIVWSFAALLIVMAFYPAASSSLLTILREKPIRIVWSLISAVLIAINWLVFVRCVQTNAVIESSLGYFITPLMSVALGVGFLGERLHWMQWLAVGVAGVGVSYIALRLGYIPYLALTLACSFGIYGMVKKQTPMAAIPGLWLETTILLLPALVYLGWLSIGQPESEKALHRAVDPWIISSGPVTTLPLLLFAVGARRIPLSQLGLLQYIAPTIQFFVGWIGLGENVSTDRWIGFAFVWLGLMIFTVSTARKKR